MCMPATCETCSGKTWTGCGAHIPRVMDDVPQEEWCKCEKQEGSKYPPGIKREIPNPLLWLKKAIWG